MKSYEALGRHPAVNLKLILTSYWMQNGVKTVENGGLIHISLLLFHSFIYRYAY